MTRNTGLILGTFLLFALGHRVAAESLPETPGRIGQVCASDVARAMYNRLIKAWNTYDAETYFGTYADELDCCYSTPC